MHALYHGMLWLVDSICITYALDDDDIVESTTEEDKGVLSKVKSNCTFKTDI